MADLILKRGQTEFDHVVLATQSTEKGAAWLAELCGAEVAITDPEPGEWYWSAALPLRDGAMIEMLGPNPDHRSFHPLKAVLHRYATPKPIFWHLATGDFERLCKVAGEAGAPVERIEQRDSDTPYGRRRYRRGVLGPGFRTARPCVIQWEARPDYPVFLQPPCCAATRFEISCPDPEGLNRVFEALGLQLRADKGRQRLAVGLHTPKGMIVLQGEGLVFEGLGALLQIAGLWAGHQLRG
ncbi:MAG: hypothetical protein Kilf2KO_37240 [Rhodospirillales bacterium]